MDFEIISGDQMKLEDKRAIEEYKIPSIVLMENAAMAFFNQVKDLSNEFVIVASTGNNGGDGLAIARHLFLNKKSVKVFMVGKKEKMTKDCKINYEILLKLGIDPIFLDKINDDLKNNIKDKILIDAIFGTGLSRNVEGFYKELIDLINDEAKYIVAVDIASGLNANDGKIMGTCIEADMTITFHRLKKGIDLADPKYKGIIFTKYIGIP